MHIFVLVFALLGVGGSVFAQSIVIERSHKVTPQIETVALPMGMSTDEAIQKYKGDGVIVEPNYIVSLDNRELTPASPLPDPQGQPNSEYAHTWNLMKIFDLPDTWSYQEQDNSVVVAVIDTGVDYNNPELAPNIYYNPAAPYSYGWNTIDNSNANRMNPMDDNGHGTHVAGIINAVANSGKNSNSVRAGVKILAVKVLDYRGYGDVSTVINGIYFVIGLKVSGVNVQIMNLSLRFYDKSILLERALRAAQQFGILAVCASGNEDTTQRAFPAGIRLDNIISVAATNYKDELADFSNRGAQWVDVAAPGDSIFSNYIWDQHIYLSGTSMATPHVTGLAGLIRSEFPTFSYKQVRDRIFNSVDYLPALSGSVLTNGRINAARALEPALVLPNAPTVFVGGAARKFQLDGEATIDWVVDPPTAGSIDHAGNFIALNPGLARVIATGSSGRKFSTSQFPVLKLNTFPLLTTKTKFDTEIVYELSYGGESVTLRLPNGLVPPRQDVQILLVQNAPKFSDDASESGPVLAISPLDTSLDVEATLQMISNVSQGNQVFGFNSELSRWELIGAVGGGPISISKFTLFTLGSGGETSDRTGPPVIHRSRGCGIASSSSKPTPLGEQGEDFANFAAVMAMATIGRRTFRKKGNRLLSTK